MTLSQSTVIRILAWLLNKGAIEKRCTDDEIAFEPTGCKDIRETDDYPRLRVRLVAHYDPIATPLKVDMTTGDKIGNDDAMKARWDAYAKGETYSEDLSFDAVYVKRHRRDVGATVTHPRENR